MNFTLPWDCENAVWSLWLVNFCLNSLFIVRYEPGWTYFCVNHWRLTTYRHRQMLWSTYPGSLPGSSYYSYCTTYSWHLTIKNPTTASLPTAKHVMIVMAAGDGVGGGSFMMVMVLVGGLWWQVYTHEMHNPLGLWGGRYPICPEAGKQANKWRKRFTSCMKTLLGCFMLESHQPLHK